MPRTSPLPLAALCVVAVAVATCGVANAQRFAVNFATMNHVTIESPCFGGFINGSDGGLFFRQLGAVLDCYKSVPMNATTAFAVAEYAQYAWELYSLRHDVPSRFGNAGQRFASLLELFNDTSATGPKGFVHPISEVEFYALVTYVFSSVRDFHFVFTPPPLFRSGLTVHPFLLSSRLHNVTGQQLLFFKAFASTWAQEASAHLRARPNLFPGGLDAIDTMEAQIAAAIEEQAADTNIGILTVNDVPAIEWAMQITEGFGSADPHASFNNMLDNNFRVPIAFLSPYTLGIHKADFNAKLPTPIVATTAPAAANLETLNDIFVMTNGRVVVIPRLVRTFVNGVDPQCGGIAEEDDEGARSAGEVKRERALREWIAMSQQRGAVSIEADGLLSDWSAVTPAATPAAATSSDSTSEQRESRRRRRLERRQQLLSERVAVSATPEQVRHTVASNSLFSAQIVPSAAEGRPGFTWLKVGTFFPQDVQMSFAYINSVVSTVQRIADTAAAVGATNLVIDLTNNGGGYIALAEALLRVLFPQFQFSASIASRRNPVSGENDVVLQSNDLEEQDRMPMMTPVTRRGAFGSTRGRTPDPPTGNIRSAAHFRRRIGRQWFDDPMTEAHNYTANATYFAYTNSTPDDLIWWVQGQRPSGYSRAANKDADLVPPYIDLVLPLTMQRLPRRFANVTLISDGQCGSACAMFEYRIRKWVSNVRSVTVGGVKARDTPQTRPQMQQFCGGRVLSLSCPPDPKRRVLAPQSDFPFPGRRDMFAARSFVSVDMNYNFYHLVADATVAPENSVPVQSLDSPADQHWWVWDLTFDEAVQRLFPGFVAGAPLSSLPPAGSGAALTTTTTTFAALMLLCSSALVLLL